MTRPAMVRSGFGLSGGSLAILGLGFLKGVNPWIFLFIAGFIYLAGGLLVTLGAGPRPPAGIGWSLRAIRLGFFGLAMLLVVYAPR